MAKKKSRGKIRRRSQNRTVRSRAVSFFIGVVTVAAIAVLLFQYAQQNNYKTVLGSKTNPPDGGEQQTPQFENLR